MKTEQTPQPRQRLTAHRPREVGALVSATMSAPSATAALPTTLPGSLPKQPTTAAALACEQRYGPAAHFLTTFSPSLQTACIAHPERTFGGTAPALSVVSAAYGRNVAKMWLSIQLNNLSEFTGVKDKLTEVQIDELSDLILAQYWYLNVAEVMYYLQQVKAGRYGRFYGAVDAMAITTGLLKFLDERRKEIDRLETRRREAAARADRRDHEENGMSRAEWEEVAWLYNMGYEPHRLAAERAARERNAEAAQH